MLFFYIRKSSSSFFVNFLESYLSIFINRINDLMRMGESTEIFNSKKYRKSINCKISLSSKKFKKLQKIF